MGNNLIYFGGVLRPPKFKDKNWNYEKIKNHSKKIIKIKLIQINLKLEALMVYIIQPINQQKILNYLDSKDKLRAIDSELAIIQRKNPELLNEFYYPAIVYLVLEEAQKGFSGQYFKKDGFDRTMKESWLIHKKNIL